MKSMTGYGRGESAQDGFKVTAELSSVNRKQSEIAVYLPRELDAVEARARDLLNKHVSRGRLSARVLVEAGVNAASGQVRLNVALAKAYALEYRKLLSELKIEDRITLDLLIRSPGVLQTNEQLSNAETLWPAIEAALTAAIKSLVKMREREGAHLAEDLKKRMNLMRKFTSRIERAATRMTAKYREQLRERIRNAGLESPPPDDERLMKEVVYYVDRSDISEELTRLASHFNQFDDCVKSRGPVGRTLDFLAQEMNREINTIGSKANDAVISRQVVLLKAELEKFREQVQNVE